MSIARYASMASTATRSRVAHPNTFISLASPHNRAFASHAVLYNSGGGTRSMRRKVQVIPFSQSWRTDTSRFFEETDTPATPLKSVKALYLPYWLIDSAFKLNAKGVGVETSVEACFTIRQSVMPGFNSLPLRSLPVRPHWGRPVSQSHGGATYRCFTYEHLKGPFEGKACEDELAGNSLDLEAHHAPTKATVQPFTLSPLHLPALLKGADASATTIEVPGDTCRFSQVTDRTFRPAEPTELLSNTPYKIVFEGSTLEVGLTFACPVLLPYYSYEFEPAVSENGSLLPSLTVLRDASGKFGNFTPLSSSQIDR